MLNFSANPINWSPSVAIAKSYARKTHRRVLGVVRDSQFGSFGIGDMLLSPTLRPRLDDLICVTANSPEEIRRLIPVGQELPIFPSLVLLGSDGRQLDMLCGSCINADVVRLLDTLDHAAPKSSSPSKALTLAKGGNGNAAEQMLAKLDLNKDAVTIGEAYLAIGEQRLGCGDVATAVLPFRRAVTLSTDHGVRFRAWLRLVAAEIRLNKTKAATEDLKRAKLEASADEQEAMMVQRMEWRLKWAISGATQPGTSHGIARPFVAR